MKIEVFLGIGYGQGASHRVIIEVEDGATEEEITE